jgi:GH18 family chitinase
MVRLFCLTILLCIAWPLRSAGADTVPSDAVGRSPRIIGYLPEYRIEKFDPAVGKLVTDVIFFSLSPTPDGGLSPEHLTDVQRRVLQALRKHGARLHFSLGGWGKSDGFATVAADNGLRAKFVARVLKFADEADFSGVDVDWEFPRGEQQIADFARLMHDLKVSLAMRQRTLSVAVACSQELPKTVIDDVDCVHLMAYDAGKQHSTREWCAEQVGVALERGIPESKLCLGIPFYGRSVDGPQVARSYAKLVQTHHPSPDKDQVGGFYFNGIHTVERKTQLALDRNLAGVMLWELGQDTNDEHSLLRAIHQTVTSRHAH